MLLITFCSSPSYQQKENIHGVGMGGLQKPRLEGHLLLVLAFHWLKHNQTVTHPILRCVNIENIQDLGAQQKKKAC